MLVNLRTPLSEDCEKLLFYTLIRPIPIMKYDIADYDRKVASHPEKNYDWLMHCCRSQIIRQRQDDNRAALDKPYHVTAVSAQHTINAEAVRKKSEPRNRLIAGKRTNRDSSNTPMHQLKLAKRGAQPRLKQQLIQ